MQAHAGDLPKSAQWGGSGKGNECVNGDTNSMAAFLIAAGDFSYYHCSCENAHGGSIWGSAPTVRARPGRLSALRVSHSKSVLYDGFVWVRMALNS